LEPLEVFPEPCDVPQSRQRGVQNRNGFGRIFMAHVAG